MSARVKVASTPQEMDGIFLARHQVYVEEEGYMAPHPDGRIYDRFDAFSSSANIVAVVDGKVVGGIRLTEESPVGTPAQTFFDFMPHLPADHGKVVSSSQFCLMRQHRTSNYRLAFAIMGMGMYWALQRGASHIVTAANPRIGAMMRRMGLQAVAPVFHDPEHGVDVLPLVLDLAQVNDTFLAFVRRQGMHDFMESFQREYYRAGEKIISAGEEGRSVYVMVEGQAKVIVRRPEQPEEVTIRELGPGEVFGELALLARRPRTANVVASTDVDVMVLDNEVFQREIMYNPSRMPQVLELLAQRLADATDLLAR